MYIIKYHNRPITKAVNFEMCDIFTPNIIFSICDRVKSLPDVVAKNLNKYWKKNPFNVIRDEVTYICLGPCTAVPFNFFLSFVKINLG